MKQVQAMVVLVLIDGVTYQILLPKNIIALQAKQALMMVQEFDGKLFKCDFCDIKPMDVEGLPFGINDSGANNKPIQNTDVTDNPPLPLIEDLNLDVRTVNRLSLAGVISTYRLIKLTEVQLLKIPGIGRGTLQEIIDALKRHNLTLWTNK